MTMPAPYFADASATLYCGEALAVLRGLPDASVAALVCDPPYSSGGAFRGDRTQRTGDKYTSSTTRRRPADFGGDTRDQRAFAYWEALWLAECWRIVEPGGSALVFTDWRQLPSTTDALQAGGFVWRGIVVWHKATGRPRRGGFRSEAEYVVWGTRGPLREDHEVYLPGVIATAGAGPDRFHAAEKPQALMSSLVEVAPPGTTILDPFAGSGSTLVAAKAAGRAAIGVEADPAACAVAASRLAQGSLLDLLGANHSLTNERTYP